MGGCFHTLLLRVVANINAQRVEEFGYGVMPRLDKNGQQVFEGKEPAEDDCQYYLLDDNRLYRRTDPPLPPPEPPKPKSTSKKAQAAKRKSKRRKVESETPEVEESELVDGDTVMTEVEAQEEVSSADIDTFGGFKWECVAITLADYQEFCEARKSKSTDINDKNLRKRLMEEVMPTIEAAEDRQKRKMERRERELLALEKMAHAKRSSRIAGKMEREKQEQEAAEAERKRLADLQAARRDRDRQEQMDQDRQSRMMTRDQRIKEREYKRILAEEELVKAAEEEKQIAEGRARGSSRQLKERVAKHKQELEQLDAEEDWHFDCSGCGKHGKNLDDGSHSVACEKCNVWQHSKCLNISKAAADKEDFHFICNDCKQKEQQKDNPITLKFKVTPSPAPPSPARPAHPLQQNVRVEVPAGPPYRPTSQGSMTNGYNSVSPAYVPRPYHYSTQPNGFTPAQHPPAHYPLQQQQQQSYPRPPSNSASPPAANQPYQYSQYYYPPTKTPQPMMQQHYQHPQQPYPQNPQLTQYQNTPRPPSSHAQQNGQPAPAARLPSPVLNRPIMSPSQGNYDVGPVAGIPQNTSFGSPNQAPPQLANGTPSLPRPPYQQAQAPQNASQRPPSSSSSSSSPPQVALSGISPTKHYPNYATHAPAPLPPPSNIPTKLSMSPTRPTSAGSPHSGAARTPAHNAQQQQRTVSGTPIIPPTEKLRPSPEQLSRMSGQGEAVPTPSKAEVMGRAVAEAEEAQKQGGVQNGSGGEGSQA
jgi:hypothetical protein